MKVRYTLRLVPELNEKIGKLAEKQGISKNALIVKVLWKIVKQQNKEQERQ